MSITDPCVLLDAMTTMLGEYGDIKGPQEVVTVIRLAKHRCVACCAKPRQFTIVHRHC